MKKATCTAFVNVLNTIHEMGITTKAELMQDQQLWAKFWEATKEFVRYAMLSKTGKTTKAGKQLSGNITKIENLEKNGITTKEDVQMDCVEQIIKYTDNMLKLSTVDHMKNYAYLAVNTKINTICRKYSMDGYRIVSLDSPVKGNGIAEEDANTYGDKVPDYTYNPEHIHDKQETIEELKKLYQDKLAEKKAEKRETILNEMKLLSEKPAEVMIRLACTHFGMKNRELAGLIISKGYRRVYARILLQTAKRNGIEPARIQEILAGHELTAEDLHAHTNSAATVSAQISRLKDRAGNRLSK